MMMTSWQQWSTLNRWIINSAIIVCISDSHNYMMGIYPFNRSYKPCTQLLYRTIILYILKARHLVRMDKEASNRQDEQDDTHYSNYDHSYGMTQHYIGERRHVQRSLVLALMFLDWKQRRFLLIKRRGMNLSLVIIISAGMGTRHAEMNGCKFPCAYNDGSQLQSCWEEETHKKSKETSILENVYQISDTKSCQKWYNWTN